MDPFKLTLLIIAIGVVYKVYRTASAHTRRRPERRGWLIAGSIAAIGLFPLLFRWMFYISPSLRESPAGLFQVLPKIAAVSLIALAGIGTLLGALFPWRNSGSA